MRRNWLILIILLIPVILLGCNEETKQLAMDNLEESYIDDSKNSKDISIHIEDNNISVEDKLIEFTYKNLSDKEFTYNAKPHLEVEINNRWFQIPLSSDIELPKHEYILLPNGHYTDELNIHECFGKLYIGKYRLVKNFESRLGNEVVLDYFNITE